MSDNKKQTNESAGVEIPAINQNSVIQWEDLTKMYKELESYIGVALQTVKTTGETFANIIENNKSIATAYIGVIKTMTDFSQELIDILDKHSVKKDLEDGKSSYSPYVGKVNTDDDKQQQLYVSLVLAYSGLFEKVQTALDVAQAHLLGLINEEVEKLELKEKPVVNDGSVVVDGTGAAAMAAIESKK